MKKTWFTFSAQSRAFTQDAILSFQYVKNILNYKYISSYIIDRNRWYGGHVLGRKGFPKS